MKTAFLHVADVHLDSPHANLRRLDHATSERMDRASRSSLEHVVEAALEHRVAAVVIAGDLFDGPVRNASAGLWAESQFRRLTREGISVVLIRGNHDAVSNANRVSRWPSGVIEFGSDQASTFVLENAGLAFHGQSFGSRVETEDLAAKYPRPSMGFFNVGLLHTSLSGSHAHDAYAPTSLTTLENAGFDYWALGHIHARSPGSLSDRCYIAYSGNTQGRHIREPGAKGCQLITVRDQAIESVRFIATDSLRWEEICVDASELEYLGDMEDQLERAANPVVAAADGRPLAIRVRIFGSSKLHAELTRFGTLERLGDVFAHRLSQIGDLWLETIKISTTPFLKGSAEDVLLPIKYLSRVTEACRHDPILREQFEESLEELLKKTRQELSEYGCPIADESKRAAEFDRLMGMAEDMLVARLLGDDAS